MNSDQIIQNAKRIERNRSDEYENQDFFSARRPCCTCRMSLTFHSPVQSGDPSPTGFIRFRSENGAPDPGRRRPNESDGKAGGGVKVDEDSVVTIGGGGGGGGGARDGGGDLGLERRVSDSRKTSSRGMFSPSVRCSLAILRLRTTSGAGGVWTMLCVGEGGAVVAMEMNDGEWRRGWVGSAVELASAVLR